VLHEITGILIDTVGACAFEFILAIATGEQGDAQGVGRPRSEQVPYTVNHHDGGMNIGWEAVGSSEKQIGIGLGVLYFVSGNCRGTWSSVKQTQSLTGEFTSPAGRDGPLHSSPGQGIQQFFRPRRRPHG